MSEVGMALGDTDLQRIGDYVKGNIYGWLVEVAPQVVAGPQILERLERIEQELVAQRQELKAQREAHGDTLRRGRRPIRGHEQAV